MLKNKLDAAIRNVPDFPKPGIMFKDITPLFLDPVLCLEVTEFFKNELQSYKLDAIVGIESRGFFFGFAIAQALGIPFIPVRKAGKLPYKTDAVEYALEYGTAKIEMHIDTVKPGWNVMIHDDLLATGGTAAAAAELIKKQKGNVACYTFLVELAFLNGRNALEKHSSKIISAITY